MLTDAILREATAEAERFLLSIVPEDGEPHVFSKRFERKMQKLIRRTNHPIRYQVMRVAAAVALAIVTLFGAVMAVSPEARAAVVGWVKSAFYEFFEYSNEVPSTNNEPTNNNDTNRPTSEPVKYEYHLSVIPEGYRELNVIEKIDGKIYFYMNESGVILQFTYTDDIANATLFIDVEKCQHRAATVHEMPADIYIALVEGETSAIVWQDIETATLLQIFAMANQNELIALAESVEKTK